MWRLALAAVLGATLFFGCGDRAERKKPKSHTFDLRAELTTPDGEAIPGAPVLLDGSTVGYTDEEGVFRARLRERVGRTVELEFGELEGYRYLEDPIVSDVLELKRDLSGSGWKGVPVLLERTAEVTEQEHLVWVRTLCDDDSLEASDCRGVPIRREGETLAETGPTGRAHFKLRERPGTAVTLSIEPPEAEGDESTAVEPKDPTYSFELGPEPRIYRLEATFRSPEDDREDGESRRRRTRPTTDSANKSARDGDRSAGDAETNESEHVSSTGSKGDSEAEPSSDEDEAEQRAEESSEADDSSSSGGSDDSEEDEDGGDDGVIELF